MRCVLRHAARFQLRTLGVVAIVIVLYCHHKSPVYVPPQVNGVPACADAKLLNNTLRQQWGFDGFVVSDCGAVEAAAWGHNYRKCGHSCCTLLLSEFASDAELSEEILSVFPALQGQCRSSCSDAVCWHGHELCRSAPPSCSCCVKPGRVQCTTTGQFLTTCPGAVQTTHIWAPHMLPV